MQTEIIKIPSTAIEPVSPEAAAFRRVADLVLDTVSERSRRDYARALLNTSGRSVDGFLPWLRSTGRQLNKASVMAYVSHMKEEGVTPSSINQRLAAIRKLAKEAADNDAIDESTAQAIARVPNIKRQGRKLGNWLSKEQAEDMINSPDVTTTKGLRDRAILAVAIGCGLRREELATLRKSDFQQREGRWVILDLEGKHGRTRTVPVASWVKHIVDVWTREQVIRGDEYLFPPMRKGGHVLDGHMTPQAVWDVVSMYSPVDKLAPHDLRRTFAKLAHKAGAPIEQIQQSLGHASIQTTERYLGVDLDLHNAPSDYIKLDV